MDIKHLSRPFELKSLDDDGTFTGYGSVFGNVDSYGEIVVPGAFAESLASWKSADRLPPVLWQHRSGEPIGTYTEMKEDDRGLFVRGKLLVEDVQRAKEARALMKAGAVNGLSIGFVTREDSYDKVSGVRTLKKVDLWEISVVTFPANPQAQISSVKSVIDGLGNLSDVERHLRDAGGFSRAEATAIVGRVKALSGQSESDQMGELKGALQSLQGLFA